MIYFLNRAIYETIWKYIVWSDRPQVTIWMRIACWIPKATNTNTEYVIHTAFPLQQSLHESASVLFYTYIASLVIVGNRKCPGSGREVNMKSTI